MRRVNVRPDRRRRPGMLAPISGTAAQASQPPERRSRRAIVVAVVLAVLGLLAGAQPSMAASKLSAKAPRSAAAGSTITVSGRSPSRASSIVVQRAQGRAWKLLAKGKPRNRKYSVKVKLGPSIAAGTVRLRVVARRKSKAIATSKAFKVNVSAPKVPGAAASKPIEDEGGRGSLGGDYPDANAIDCSGRFGVYSWCKNGNWISGRGYGYRNCTDYAAWVLGLPGGLGNANTWKDRAARAGLSVRGSASVGDVAWWGGGGFGHVAVVTAVHPSGAVDTVDYNGDGRGNKTVRQQTRADAYLHPAQPPAIIVAPGGAPPTAPGQPVADGDRIGVIYGDGTVAVKENGTGAPFVTVTGQAAQLALAGNRVAVRFADGRVAVKEGPLDAGFTEIAGNAAQVSMAGNRIAVLFNDGRVAVKEGPVNAGFTEIAGNASQVELAGDRIAVRFGDGQVAVKEGPVNAGFTVVAGNAAQVSLTPSRIGVLYNDRRVEVKEGPVNAGFTEIAGNASQVELAGDRIAVRFADGRVAVKEGPVNAGFTEIAGSAKQVSMSGNRIAVLFNDARVAIKDGGVGAGFTEVATGAASVAVLR